MANEVTVGRTVVNSIEPYIKGIIAGQKVELNGFQSMAIAALKGARTSIGCVTGRETVARERVQAELKRLKDKFPAKESAQAKPSEAAHV